MFWTAFAGGFACGTFAAIVLLFCGALWAMGRQPFDDGEDDHALWPGADAGFSNHNLGV